MTIRAHIAHRYLGDAIDVYIVNHQDGHMRLMRPTDEGHTKWEDMGREDEARLGADPPPTFALPYDSGRALLQALIEHYQGAEDTRALRRDYDAERKRVDEHAQTISEIARLLAGRTAP